ncbi:MAG: type II toxin-antitoxin system RelE/ParE family toxin [Thermoplasmata archaeon]|nr:type II toxin-antitoxin system RelE/ParE family toxin [Candidatus Sysuiplasma acidicola]
MAYEVYLTSEAERFLKKCDRVVRDRIVSKLTKLGVDPEAGKPLTAALTGLWSLRIGDYRAIYEIKNAELLVLVIKIGHRKNAYD